MTAPTTTDATSDWRMIDTCPEHIDTANSDMGLSSIHVVGDRSVTGTFFSARDIADLVGVESPESVYDSIPHEHRVKIKIADAWAVYLDTAGLIMCLVSSECGRKTTYIQRVMNNITTHSVGACRLSELAAELERVKREAAAASKAHDEARAFDARRARQLAEATAREMEGLRAALKAAEEARKAAEEARKATEEALAASQAQLAALQTQLAALQAQLAASQAQLIELAMTTPARKRVKRA
ncbi:hypothetical protein SARC_00077 [Sphaeroforma arctica JP610]|uniref:Bro-N domain-containing protein n=1 Tax=Sphaeroforma arctica JP610 TaxID=667725 RepID=A0A0L0GFG4_9EUKA|nr:hypothetical protein SARC_00077 [Sphaeroforma arctica JP610]KNC87820.1 hypothetical protein SARC_00077 [Sphaeroforma arctica JP610]|eukprot:XP_014161722.1 hypothetical protein SARC_00077 [Sphaeroforma arctica JP610]